MLNTKKAPTLARRRGTSTGANPRRQGNSTLFPARWEAVPGVFSLTSGRPAGMVEAPNQSRRNKRRSSLPKAGKSLVAYSACLAAGGVSIGKLAHIGGVATSSIREDWRLHLSRGGLLPRLFFLNPKAM